MSAMPDKFAKPAGNRPPTIFFLALILVCSAVHPVEVFAQDGSAIGRIKWVTGPAKVNLGSVAQIELPSGYRFTDAAGANLWNQANGNPPDNATVGVLIPPPEVFAANQGWSVTFRYEDCGHVSDDDKLDDTTNAAILDAITQNTAQQNNERLAHGWKQLKVLGWQQPPFYDPDGHRLTWSTSVSDDGSVTPDIVNYSSRLLGRTGVMSANLVTSPDNLAAALPTYRSLTGSVAFVSGNRYREYKSGDRVAKFGLVGLVSGGLAVAAVKGSYLLVKLGAILVALAAGALVKVKSWFARKSPATAGNAAGDTSTAGGPSASAAKPGVVKCPVCGQSNRTSLKQGDARCGRCHASLPNA